MQATGVLSLVVCGGFQFLGPASRNDYPSPVSEQASPPSPGELTGWFTRSDPETQTFGASRCASREAAPLPRHASFHRLAPTPIRNTLPMASGSHFHRVGPGLTGSG